MLHYLVVWQTTPQTAEEMLEDGKMPYKLNLNLAVMFND